MGCIALLKRGFVTAATPQVMPQEKARAACQAPSLPRDRDGQLRAGPGRGFGRGRGDRGSPGSSEELMPALPVGHGPRGIHTEFAGAPRKVVGKG